MILEQTAESNSTITDAEFEEVDELVEGDARERLY